MRALETLGAACAVIGILGAVGLAVDHASRGDWWPAAAGTGALLLAALLRLGAGLTSVGEDAERH